jgi:hypothetical protein
LTRIFFLTTTLYSFYEAYCNYGDIKQRSSINFKEKKLSLKMRQPCHLETICQTYAT